MKFEDLNIGPSLITSLHEIGYSAPTPIQERVFSVVMSGRDVCGIAQTGTGKTLAYLLPLIRLWKYTREKNPTILILVPTRELVTQIVATVKQLTGNMSLNVAGVYGGTNINTQRADIQEGVHILVATPGRVYDLALNGAFRTKAIKHLVIDEVDEMLNLGFRSQIKNILELLPQRRQNLMFSATMIPEVRSLLHVYFNDPVQIEAAPAGTPVDKITQFAYTVPNFNTKVNLLLHLLDSDHQMNKVLVFTSTRKMADQVFEKVESLYEGSAGVIHSNKEQNHRFNTVSRFKEGTYRFIIATDVIARGIDVSDVSHVVNFDLPESVDYLHRIGRTGRAGKNGIALTFVLEKEVEQLKKISDSLQAEISITELPPNLIVSHELTEDEMPKTSQKEIRLKLSKADEAGASFHDKSAKNKKVNFTVSRKDKMMKKYGKPKTRGQKK